MLIAHDKGQLEPLFCKFPEKTDGDSTTEADLFAEDANLEFLSIFCAGDKMIVDGKVLLWEYEMEGNNTPREAAPFKSAIRSSLEV